MARKDRDYRGGRRYEFDDPYDRDEGETYGQYGNLHRGLGYGGGRDPEDLDRFGHGRNPDSYPERYPDRNQSQGRHSDEERDFRGRPSHGPGWQEPGWQDEVESHGLRDRSSQREVDHRGKGPRGYRRADERIQDDINERLTSDRDVDATDITVSVKDGEVTLDGQVDSRRAKRAAEDCADSVTGVTHIQNNLRVRSA